MAPLSSAGAFGALRESIAAASAQALRSGENLRVAPGQRSLGAPTPETALDAPLLLTRDVDLAVVTLNRPEKLNAIPRALWPELAATLRMLAADDGVRCVVLRGGGGNFGAGADIAEFPAVRANAAQAREYGALMHAALRAVAECRHPTVALIEGACVGAGLELASSCDLRIAGASSRFGVPIARIGVTMAVPELEALVGVVGRAAALAILLEGRVFDSTEALRLGLVTRVVPDDQVEAEALACARRVAAGAPLVHRWHKVAARRLAPPAPLGEAEADGAYAPFDSNDFREGVESFLLKRPALFGGR